MEKSMLRERRQSSYEECLSFVRKRCLRSRLKKQKQYLDQRTKRLFKREKRVRVSKHESKWSRAKSFHHKLQHLCYHHLPLAQAMRVNALLIRREKMIPFILPNDALNWTGYRVIYIINRTDVTCKDFGKNFTSYKIPLLQSGWKMAALVTLLPYPTGYRLSTPGNKKRNTIIVGVVLAIAFLASIIVTMRYCRRSQTDLTPSMPG
ncbi:hypothetical protein pdam_00015890 [Pocillopora damicornis]|uniref:Uncharacterized protein n=1 Tax=Pocillopora damicornis TaxID=46731 RepID=A0A3M6URC7_POCDA|nr:hypothetical protein pdam_00015890 [Pocillopora damicornis]